MKAILVIFLGALFWIVHWADASTVVAATKTNLLTGITYFYGPEALSGKLVFLVDREPLGIRAKTNSAGIYEFDIRQRKLTKICDAPGGLFIPSLDGRSLYSVRYWTNPGMPSSDTNVFIWSGHSGGARLVYLRQPPENTVLFGGRVFFQAPAFPFSNGTRILLYNPEDDTQRSIEFSDASKWQYQDYRNFMVSLRRSNLFVFEYAAFGRRLGSGIDYPRGNYCLHLDTGEITKLLPPDAVAFDGTTADGRYVFFDGPEGLGTPAHGYKLVSSPRSAFQTRSRDSEATSQFRVLHTFEERGRSLYTVQQLSPCRNYALVSLAIPFGNIFTSRDRVGYLRKYYLVNVHNGQTRLLVEENVLRETKGFMSEQIWWVP